MGYTDGDEPVERKVMKEREKEEVIAGAESLRMRIDGIPSTSRGWP